MKKVCINQNVHYICVTKGNNMTLQDLTNNKERIIKKIKFQITMATTNNIKDVMEKMVAMLPQFESEKPTMSNIDKLTSKATLSYIKNGLKFTQEQANRIDEVLEQKRKDSLPSNLQY